MITVWREGMIHTFVHMIIARDKPALVITFFTGAASILIHARGPAAVFIHARGSRTRLL